MYLYMMALNKKLKDEQKLLGYIFWEPQVSQKHLCLSHN